MNIDLIKEILGKKVNITRQVSDIFFNLKGETWPDRPIRSNTKDEEFSRGFEPKPLIQRRNIRQRRTIAGVKKSDSKKQGAQEHYQDSS